MKRLQTPKAQPGDEASCAVALEALNEHVAYYDTDLRIRWLNRGAWKTAQARGVHDPIGRPCYEVWHGTERPCQACPVLAALAYGQGREAEIVSADGTVWLVRGHAVRDAAGTVVGAVEVSLDITERKRAQEALVSRKEELETEVARRIGELEKLNEDLRAEVARRQTSEESLRQANAEMQSVLDGAVPMVAIDRDRTIARPNRHFARLVDQDIGDLVGRKCFDVWRSGICGSDSCPLRRVLSGEQSCTCQTQREVRGDRRAYAVTACPLRGPDREVRGAVISIQDTTDLRQMEEGYRRLFEGSRDALITLHGPNWRFRTANAAALALFGAPDEAALAKLHPWDLSPPTQPDGETSVDKARRIVQRVLDTGSHFFEWTHRRLDGTLFPATVLLTRVDDPRDTFLQATVRDITEQKRAEQQLAEERRFTVNALESLADMFYVLDRDGRFLRWNRVLLEVGGYSEEQMPHLRVGDLFHPDDTPKVEQAVQAVWDEGSAHVEARFRTPDGYVPYECTGRLLHDPKGRPIGLCGTGRDMRRQKQAQEQLRRFRQALDSSADGIFVIDRATMLFTDMNETARQQIGYERDELLRMGPQDIKPEYTGQELGALFDRTIRTGQTTTIETVHQRKDGSTFPVEVFLRAIQSEGRSYLIAAVRDVSLRRRREADLRRFGIAIETCYDAIAMSTPNGQHFYQNRSFTEMFGYATAEELAAAGGGKTLYVDPAVGEEVFGTICNGQAWSGEARMRVKDGHERTVLLRANPVHDADGTVLAVIGVHTDISARKEAEEELRSLNEHLEDETARANQMAAQAECASAAKSEFLANMSHEIRTPMTTILGYADLLPEMGPDDPQWRDHTAAIRRSGEHLLSLINDILDLSRAEAGKLHLDEKPVPIVPLVGEVASMLRPKANERGNELEVRYVTPIPRCLSTDEIRLRQALVNLTGNAVKFTENGRVRIEVSFLPNWRADRAAVCFRVSDTGIGIPADKLETLFQPFARGDESMSRAYSGTGLGLSITRRIVERMDGEVTVDSQVGTGSTFSLFVPAGNPENTAMLHNSDEIEQERDRPEAPVARTARLDGIRVLLAEDGRENQRLITTLLRKAGAAVETVQNGQRAVERAGAAAFDVILMDMQMPVLDGYAATRQLREAGYNGPILALTAHGMAGDRQKSLDAGCDDHLTKPIDRARLLGQVAHYAGASSPGAATDGDPAGSDAAPPLESELAGDPDIAEILGEFVAGLADRVATMRQALADGAYDELRRAAHQLKGAGGGYGYPQISQTAAALQQAAEARDDDACRLGLDQLAELADAALRGHRVATATEEPHEGADD